MTDLLTALQSAERGSRELDARVCAALGYHSGFPDYEYTVPWRVEADDGALVGYICPPGEREERRWKRSPEPVTQSTDAALALVERELPEMFWSLGFLPDNDDYECEDHHKHFAGLHPYLHVADPRDVHGYGATPPLALVIALVKTKEAM
jgi:hypothetical protein